MSAPSNTDGSLFIFLGSAALSSVNFPGLEGYISFRAQWWEAGVDGCRPQLHMAVGDSFQRIPKDSYDAGGLTVRIWQPVSWME